MNKLTVAAFGLAVLGFASISASAQQFVPTGLQDLILGFRVTDNMGTGSTSNLEVDLGAASMYTSTYSANLAGPTALTGADLAATYGSNFATRGDLTWGVAGDVTVATSSDTFDVSLNVPARTAGTLTSPYNNAGALVNGLSGVAPTANSSEAGIVPSTQGNSFTAETADQQGGDYGYFAPGDAQVNNGSGVTLGSIGLYNYFPSGGKQPPLGTLLGTFTLTDVGGTVGFTYNGVNAVSTPEPSAYALGICAVLLFLVLRRRQTVA